MDVEPRREFGTQRSKTLLARAHHRIMQHNLRVPLHAAHNTAHTNSFDQASIFKKMR